MKRRNFFKSIGVAGLLPIIPKERLYTFYDICDMATGKKNTVVYCFQINGIDYVNILTFIKQKITAIEFKKVKNTKFFRKVL
jgi:hypothetical protein